MKFIPVLKWMIAIVLVVACVATGAGFYLLNQKEDFVRAEILKRFAEIAPDLTLRIGDIRLDGTQGATLSDIEVRERASDNPLLLAETLKVAIDSNALLEQQQVVVDVVHLRSAEVLVIREADGRWNWQDYEFRPPKATGLLPIVTLEDVGVRLTLKHGNGVPPARLALRKSRIQAVPDSSQGYEFDGAIELPGAGPLGLSGSWNLQTGDWQLGGQLRDVQADQQLMDLAKGTSPQLNGHLDQLDSVIRQAVPAKDSSDGLSSGAALQIGNNNRVAPVFLGQLDIDFAVSGGPARAVPAFKLLVNVREGRISTPAIPFALTGVRARFFRDNESLVFRLDQATGNDASLRGGFEMLSSPGAKAPYGWFEVERFPVTAKLKPLLPERTLRLFNAFEPDILLSVSGRIERCPDGKWLPHDVKAEVHDGSVLFHRFRYPVENLKGTIVQRPFADRAATEKESVTTVEDVVLDVTMQADIGPKSITTAGWWKNPGPRTETRFEMSLQDFPMDSRFRNALGEKEQSVFDALDLSGTIGADMVFYRPPGVDQPTHTFIDAHVKDARMRFRSFPYDITDLSGHITYNSATRHWKFIELSGRHGEGVINGIGDFHGHPSPGVLTLEVSARNAPLEADLYNALSKSQRAIWNMVNPNGHCDLTAEIHWTATPGQAAIVRFPRSKPVRIYNTQIRPAPFPYDMLVREAVLSFDPNDPHAAGSQHCEIHSFQAEHGDSPIQARGWAEAKPDGEWQVHLNNVTASNLVPDDHLKAALPASWRETLNRVYQVGRVSIRDSELDFRGDIEGRRNTTAGWDLNLSFRDCKLNAGLDVLHVFGDVTARGVWDGFHLRNNGNIDIETAEVLEMPFTAISGPYSLNDIELVLGSRRVFEPDSTLAQVDRTGRVRALAYGGEVVFDAHVDLREGGKYQFFTEVADARLESYAALHMPEERGLQGVVTAWLSVEGTGEEAKDVTGKGQLLINPARLYELPVVVKLLGALSQLNLNVQDRTAFNYALLDFDVADEAFWFKTIDLVGDSISFRGRGSVGFGGAVDLDFYSHTARSRTTALPFISGLFTSWAKVEVRGTTDRPQTMVRSMARLDEGLRQFLQPFNPSPGGPIPGLNVPQFFQRATPLLQRFPSARQAGTPTEPRQ